MHFNSETAVLEEEALTLKPEVVFVKPGRARGKIVT